MEFVTTGLVLRQTKVREADAILEILTPEHGIITAGARGCLRLKNKLFSGCGLFCFSEFVISRGRSTNFVNDAQVKNAFFGIRSTVEGTALAMYLAEIAAALSPDGEEGARQLRLLLNSFYLISEGKADIRQIKAVYELRSVCEGGYMPDLLCCHNCGAFDGRPFYFDMENARLECEECAKEANHRPNLDGGALAALRHIALADEKKIFSFQLKPESMVLLCSIAERYAGLCLDKTLKSLAFLKTVM